MAAIGQCWLVPFNQSNFYRFFRNHLVIGQCTFSLYFIGHHTGIVNLSEQKETDLITGSDQVVRVVHSCNSFLSKLQGKLL